MITLTKGNAAAERFLKDQKLSQGARYRWLAFVYPYQDGERRLVYNLLTNRLCRMENGDVPFGKDVRFSAGEVRQSPELSMLMRDYYLVREDEDDSRLYENLERAFFGALDAVRNALRQKHKTLVADLPETAFADADVGRNLGLLGALFCRGWRGFLKC